MTRYVITIAPDNDGTPDAATAQTTVRVDTSSGDARITELTVRSAGGGGLAPADLPAFDLERLIRALAAPPAVRALPATQAHDIPTSAAPETHAPSPGPGAPVVTGHAPETLEEHVLAEPAEPATEPFITAVDESAAGGFAEQPEPPRRRAGAKRVAAKKAAKKVTGRKAPARKATAEATAVKKAATARAGGARKAAGGAAAQKATGAKATGAKAPGRKAATAKSTRASGQRDGVRAYRRMPEAAEVLAAYAEAGSITGLAQHYGVPRHTANGWARRLRQQGHAIGRG